MNFTNPDLAAEFERQHESCRQCHPELGRDWLRAGTYGAILAGSLLFWGWVVSELPGWLAR